MAGNAIFGKADIEKILGQGNTPVDMHFHTNHSDAFTKVEQILKSCSQKRIGVAITDHNSINGVIEAFHKKGETLVIPAVEVTAKERCHFIFYFPKLSELKEFFYTYVEPNKTENPYGFIKLGGMELLKNSQRYDCLRVAAHPFAQTYYGVYKSIQKGNLPQQIVKEFEAIEVINAVCRRSWNRRAFEWATELGKPMTGGSDGHSLFQLGTVISYNKGKTAKSFLECVRNGESNVVGEETKLVRLLGNSRSIAKHLRYSKPILKLKAPLRKLRAR